MALVHGLDEATDMIADVLKMQPPIDVELKLCEAQQLLCEMLAILQDSKGADHEKLIERLFWRSRRPTPTDQARGRRRKNAIEI